MMCKIMNIKKNNKVYTMRKIHEIGIPTHYIKKLNMREQLVKKVEIIPVEFVVRNIAAGSIVKRPSIEVFFTIIVILCCPKNQS